MVTASFPQKIPCSCKQPQINSLIRQRKTGGDHDWGRYCCLIAAEGTFVDTPEMLVSKPWRWDLSLTIFHKVGTPTEDQCLSTFLFYWWRPWPKVTWGVKGLTGLQVTAQHRAKSKQESEGRNQSKDHEGTQLTGLFSCLSYTTQACLPGMKHSSWAGSSCIS